LTFKNNPPVTTGAYMFMKAYPEQKIFVYQRNENYWNKEVKPGPKYVIYRSGPAADQILAEAKTNSTDL
jgi:peptide/nickel transport system substrate-binding protein